VRRQEFFVARRGSCRIGARLRLILIAAFGALGTLARYGLQGVVQIRSGSAFPYGGGSSVYHTDKLLRLSQDLPIIVEVVEHAERIEKILPRLDEMVEGGLITLEKVRVILYRAAKK